MEAIEQIKDYQETKQELKDLLLNILDKGEISVTDKEELEVLMSQEKIKFEESKKLNPEEKKKEVLTKEKLVDLLTNGGEHTLLSIDDEGNLVIDGTSIPQFTLLTKKLSLIAQDGEDESSIQITPQFIKAIAESDIELSAKKILINGLLSGQGWRIDEEGNLEVNDLNIKGNLTCDSLNVSNLISAGMEKTLTQSETYEVKGEELSTLMDTLPHNLGGNTLSFKFTEDITQNIEFRNFYNGTVNIYFNGKALKGYLKGNKMSAILNIYGGATSSDTVVGSVMPYSACISGSYAYSMLFVDCDNVGVSGINVFGDKANTTKSVGIGAISKTRIDLNKINFQDCKYNFRSYTLAQCYCESSTGVSSSHSWCVGKGATLILNDTTQAGGKNNTYKSGNGQIYDTGVTYSTTANTGTNTNTNNPTTTNEIEKVVTFKPVDLDTYRSTVYNNFKGDKSCRQGSWGYGNCNGYFFYGNQFEGVKGKNITKATITLNRLSNAGYSASTRHTIKAHSYNTKPTTVPNFGNTATTVNLAWGETQTVEITNSAILTGISNGTIKGFGVQDTYDKTHYSSLSNGTVKIYYKENSTTEGK